ncbi:MAG: 30S ribosomal protein S20 [Bacteriovoracaceae bacterium]|nr:30S ribosomal protein S20 [Bacteriovoracaceae bacterium]
MANHKSAAKRAKQSEKKRAHNRSKSSAVKTAIKAIRQLIDSDKMDEAKKILPAIQSKIAKLAKTNIIKKKTASRKISRIAAKVTTKK